MYICPHCNSESISTWKFLYYCWNKNRFKCSSCNYWLVIHTNVEAPWHFSKRLFEMPGLIFAPPLIGFIAGLILVLSANFIYGLSDKNATILLVVFGIYICFDGYFSALRTIRSSRVVIPDKQSSSKTFEVLEEFSELAKNPAARNHMIKLNIFRAQLLIYFWLATKALKLVIHAT